MHGHVNNLNDDVDELSVSDSYTCTPEQAHTYLHSPRKYLNILAQNIRSINYNFNSFLTLLGRFAFVNDIIVLSECWLPCNNNLIIPSIQNYTMVHTTKHLNQSDGVVVFINSNIYYSCEEPDFESSASGLLIKLNCDIAILCIYRSPSNDNINSFILALKNILSLLSKFKTVVITGDINIDIKPGSFDSRSQDYLNTLAFYGYLPAHTTPTRGNNCLDHVILRTKSPAITLILDTTVTDHYSTLISLAKQITKTAKFHTVAKVNYETLDKTIKKIDLSYITAIDNPDIATDGLIKCLAQAITENTTVLRLPNRKRTLKPWITQGLLKCMRNRDLMHRKVKKFPDNEVLKLTYKRYRNFCSKILNKAKRLYDSQEINRAGKNIKQLWDSLKKICLTSKPKQHSTQLLISGYSILQSCNNANSFFVSIGKELADKIRLNSNSVSVSKGSTSINRLSSFVLEHTSSEEIICTISSLKPTAATGWDGISAIILKRYSQTLAPILCHIFNQCFALGVFPTAFKKAIVIPIFKGGDEKSINNYRPIAILTAMSKVLERLVCKRLVNYLEHFKLISTQQFGFRKSKSTNDAILELTDNIIKHLNNGNKVLTVFLDLAKAFDTVPIPTLLVKLEGMGIRGNQLNFFCSYLTGRSQITKIDNYLSDDLPISYGVPQGSVLGPTLFLVFINDLCNLRIQNTQIVSFADDTAITFYAKTWAELQTTAQLGINTTYDWLLSHSLTLNTTKTKFMTYSIRTISQPVTPINIKVHCCSNRLSTNCHCTSLISTVKIKYLGIILDQNLNYKDHVDLLTSRVRKLIFIFKNLRNVANSDVIRNVYYALCQSIVLYCISCWGGTSKTTLKPLEIAQRAVLKVATFRPILYPTSMLYKECDVLSVRKLFILNIILLQHKITPYRHIEKRRRDKICTLRAPKLAFTKRFCYYLGPFLYNKLNAELPIYNLPLTQCKRKVTSFLLDKSYEETEDFLHSVI